jgi:uncharacterized membrane protein
MKLEAIITILLMTIATVITRVGGLWLMGRIKMSPVVERWLKNLPGSLIIAIVAPGILTGGFSGITAAAIVLVVMITTKNLLFAMVAGATTISLLRNF